MEVLTQAALVKALRDWLAQASQGEIDALKAALGCQ